jgi:beta-carotene hydroxylase
LDHAIMTLHVPRVRNRADIPQVLNALAGPFVLTAPLTLGLRGWPLFAAWLGVWLYICRHNYILHNHVHHPFTDSKRLNRWLDYSLGFVTAMTAGNWRIMHVHGHHAEHLAAKLPTRTHASRLRVDDMQHVSAWQAAAHCFLSVPYQFAYPIWICLKVTLAGEGFRTPYYRYHLREAAIVYAAIAGVVWVCGWVAALYLLPIYYLVYFFSRHVDYITHVGAASSAEVAYSNVCLSPAFNRRYWNFGYHVAHHCAPRAHWTLLPQIYRSLGVSSAQRASVEPLNIYGLFRPPRLRWLPIATQSNADTAPQSKPHGAEGMRAR